MVMRKQLNELTEEIATDVYRGNVANAKRITGLEQLLPDYNHLDSSGSASNAITDAIVKRFQGKQATNTYGGITRVAWTSDDAPGTYWESNVYQHHGTVGFGISSGNANDACQRLVEALAMSSYGATTPNVLVSGFKPYNDYQQAMTGFTQITRNGSEMQGANITFDNIKVKNASWFWDDFCKQYNSIGGAVNTSFDTIYGFNTDYLMFKVDPRANMTLTDTRTTVDQFAGVRHILWRGQLVCTNPRTQFRYFDYTTS